MGHLHKGIILDRKKERFTLRDNRMDLEKVMLSEISQPERDKCYDLPHRWNPVSKLNKQGKWGQTPRWRADDSSWASGVGGRGGGIEQKGKRAYEHGQQCSECGGEGVIRGLTGNGKKIQD